MFQTISKHNKYFVLGIGKLIAIIARNSINHEIYLEAVASMYMDRLMQHD